MSEKLEKRERKNISNDGMQEARKELNSALLHMVAIDFEFMQFKWRNTFQPIFSKIENLVIEFQEKLKQVENENKS